LSGEPANLVRFPNVKAEAMVSVRLVEVTADTVRAVTTLKVSPEQEKFVAPNALSIAEAYFTKEHWFRAIAADNELVGFVMLYTKVEDGALFVWRFMIDQRHQGRGLGGAALNAVVDEVKTWPGVSALRLSFVDQPGGPEPFYAANGFRRTGSIVDGEVEAELRPLSPA
jgi:diamine N-acetyltransferase